MSQNQEDTHFTTLYFGYASNLSPETVKQRCPDSLYAGMAVLKDWKFCINVTRYANIVPSPGDVVYGCLAFLSHRDEMALDTSEGVPWLYEKRKLPVTRIKEDGSPLSDQTVNVMTYVDVQRTDQDGTIEPDYVIWINKAIKHGIQAGIPGEYFDKYVRPYTPEEALRDIVMIRTHQSQVYSPAQEKMYANYNKMRAKDPAIAEALEAKQEGLVETQP